MTEFQSEQVERQRKYTIRMAARAYKTQLKADEITAGWAVNRLDRMIQEAVE